MAEKYLGESIAKLGFGFMRLPTKGGQTEIDMDQVCKMVDLFLERGFTYFDTAYVYHNGMSEVALREALVKRYPRDAFTVATKMPFFALKEKSELETFFNTSLERMGVDFFDFYLLHNMAGEGLQKAESLGGWDFINEKKAKGQIRHIGCSSHAKPDELDGLLTRHPETEFIQLQINYIDWNDKGVRARECYEVARAHNKPIVIMEPIKGGFLAGLTPEIRELFAQVDTTPADIALRFSAGLDGVITVLSGMSTLEQVEENTGKMQHWKPLGEAERGAVQKAIQIIESTPRIPCTDCKYCMEVCPQNIAIPNILSVMNDFTTYGTTKDAANAIKRGYGFRSGPVKASECLSCGSCEKQCPQHIGIIEELKKAVEIFESKA